MNPGDASSEGAASILRAVGSLLVALSGVNQGQVGRTLDDMLAQEPQPEPMPHGHQPNEGRSQSAPDRATERTRPGYPQPQGRPQGRPSSAAPGQIPSRQAAEHHVAGAASGGSGAASTGEMFDEVEFVLTDARERAQRIIDESMEQARELIDRERAITAPVVGIDPRAFDDLRRGLRGLVTEVRDIQQRLARIEALIREQNERQARAPEPYTPVAYTEPATPEPASAWYAPEPPHAPAYGPDTGAGEEASADQPAAVEDEPIAPFPSVYEEPEVTASFGLTGAPSAPDEPAAEDYFVEHPQDEAPLAPFAPAPAPPRSGFSVVPPQRREWVPEPEEDASRDAPLPPAVEDLEELEREYGTPPPVFTTNVEPDEFAALPPSPPPAATPPSPAASVPAGAEEWDEAYEAYEPAAAGLSGSPLVTFLPSDGAITLRVAPVAGFQGLMRIQDALTRLPVVRHASVEAYSQGEARLRIELADTSDSDEIAEGLARALRGPARVEDASEVNRELLIALR